MKILDQLISAFRQAAVYNKDVQVRPHCILWPDRERQWEAILPQLRGLLPELFTFGDFNPQLRQGPGIWFRCVLANTVEEYHLSPDVVPVLYLPGVGRQDLRAVESCPDHLKPIAELQYRGVTWNQVNSKDWTILAFLKSDQGGLGLDVAQDNACKQAMQVALYRFIDEEVDLLKGKRLDKDYFNTLLTGGDPVKDMLLWLDRQDGFRQERSENEWQAFAAVCKSQFAINPENDGALAGADRLAAHEGPWSSVWERYCEAPQLYPNIPDLIRKTTVRSNDLFVDKSGWPQHNEERENALRLDLKNLAQKAEHVARSSLLNLEKDHKKRRDWVWSKIGEAPLAMALEYLAQLAEFTSQALAAGDLKDLLSVYTNQGWQADRAVILAMSQVSKPEDVGVVSGVIQAIYKPWVESSARYLQNLCKAQGYPGNSQDRLEKSSLPESTLFLFVDGLRLDCARMLSDKIKSLLSAKNIHIEEDFHWCALPTVTTTGKPAVSPVWAFFSGSDPSNDFEPILAETGQSLQGGYHLSKTLKDQGYQVLGKNETGNPQGYAWTEFGNLDHEGHDRGWKLCAAIDPLIAEIAQRIGELIRSGWQNIRVVTDHGWLLVPGGLPKLDLPHVLTENKWGRCAVLKQGSVTDEKTFPWYWNPDEHIALADGISCFRQGHEYAHGGLSLQECLTVQLQISSVMGGGSNIKIGRVSWKGLRCKVELTEPNTAISMDIRLHAGNASSSVVAHINNVKEDGTVSVAMEDQDHEGKEATIVFLDSQGAIVGQQHTIIGGEK